MPALSYLFLPGSIPAQKSACIHLGNKSPLKEEVGRATYSEEFVCN